MFKVYEKEGRPFIFMDEIWINKNCAPTHVWTDGTQDLEDKVPPGKGQRWIILAAGSKDG